MSLEDVPPPPYNADGRFVGTEIVQILDSLSHVVSNLNHQTGHFKFKFRDTVTHN